MNPKPSGLFAFAKGAFFKICFCVGLLTSLGYLVNHVKGFFSFTSSWSELGASAKNESLQDKVQALMMNTENPAVDGNPALHSVHAPVRSSSSRLVKTQVVKALPLFGAGLAGKNLADKEKSVLAASTEANASPAPSASPSPASEAASTSTGTATGAETQAQISEAPQNNSAQAPFHPTENSGVNSSLPPVTESGGGSNVDPQNSVPNAANDLSSGNSEMIGSGFPSSMNSNSSDPIISQSGSASAAASTASTYALSKQDLAWLSAPIAGVASDRSYFISGVTYDYPNRTLATASQFQVYQLRWGIEQGINPSVGFALNGNASSSKPSFSLTLRMQDINHNETPVTVNLLPEPGGVTYQQENKSGVIYNVYNFSFANVVVNGSDTLSNIKASLIYQMNGQTATLSNASSLTFSRSNVSTLGSDWSFTNPNPPIQANQEYFIADELQYVITLEKP